MIEVLKQTVVYFEHMVRTLQLRDESEPAQLLFKLRQAIAELESQEQPLPPVEIGVDVTADGASVVALYRRPNAVMEVFYSQFHPTPQRTWVGLTDDEIALVNADYPNPWNVAKAIEAKLKEKNT